MYPVDITHLSDDCCERIFITFPKFRINSLFQLAVICLNYGLHLQSPFCSNEKLSHWAYIRIRVTSCNLCILVWCVYYFGRLKTSNNVFFFLSFNVELQSTRFWEEKKQQLLSKDDGLKITKKYFFLSLFYFPAYLFCDLKLDAIFQKDDVNIKGLCHTGVLEKEVLSWGRGEFFPLLINYSKIEGWLFI